MNLPEKLKHYRFQVKDLIILFAVLLLFQTLLSYINSSSTGNLLNKTMEFYRKDTAENFADLTATSLELLLEKELNTSRTAESRKFTIRQFNIILSQQVLRQNVTDLCILVNAGEKLLAIDDGNRLYDYFFEKEQRPQNRTGHYREALRYFRENREAFLREEQIRSYMDEARAFNVLVPFGPMGEVAGAVYMKISPDFSNIATEISSVSGETGAIFSALILLALLINFYMSSYMLRDRDLAQQQLFEERRLQMRQQIEHEKEAVFTRRIYHAHHKAEKIMGFIKKDIRALTAANLHSARERILKYSNFVSRVIYDMKSYEPPLEVIRNPMFRTDINAVSRFIVENIFGRVYREEAVARFRLLPDDKLPPVPVNEYVVWEILEPLIQNCLDHNSDRQVEITIRTVFDPQSGLSRVVIADNGRGIDAALLETDEDGVPRIFREHTTTKQGGRNSGYGCYLAYEISRKWCAWSLEAANRPQGGAEFVITIPNQKGSQA